MKPYKIKIASNDGQIVGVKMLTFEQYCVIRELFEDMTKNESPNASFNIEGSDIEFGIKECPREETEIDESNGQYRIKYVGESLGL